MVINGQQEGLLFIGRPPLVDGGVVLPEFADARAFPSPPGSGAWFGLTDEVWKAGFGKGGNGLAVALETEAGFQFIGHELKVGRLLERQERFEERNSAGRPVRPMVATRGFGREPRTLLQETGAEPVKVSTADLEVEGGISRINITLIELSEDLLEKWVGQTFCDLVLLIATSQFNRCSLVEGFHRPSLREGRRKPSTKEQPPLPKHLSPFEFPLSPFVPAPITEKLKRNRNEAAKERRERKENKR